MNKNLKTILLYAAVFIWPFIYCFRFVISGESFSLTISNDFYYLYDLKVYQLDKLSNFIFPLWSPSESCGYPFYSNPHAQAFYPLNLLLTIFYKIAGGYSYADHQKFTVLGVSIFSVGLLAWLRSLNVNIIYAVIAVCLVSVSSKMTEILRFPNAVHTVAWIPFILYGCTVAASKKNKIFPAVIIFLSTILMISAGYSYNAYHSIFLIIPYVLLLVFLIRKNICFKIPNFSITGYFIKLLISFSSAVIICYPYIKGILGQMNNVAFRKGKDFEFSTFYKFSFEDTIGSLVYPPAAPIEGWYYFGIASLLIVSAVFIYFILNKTEYRNELIIFSIIFVWYCIISYITYGENSFLFKILWDYFPGFSRLRVWGRMNVILVPVYCFMLAYSIKFISKLIENKFSDLKTGRSIFLKTIVVFVSVYLIIISAQIYLLKTTEVQQQTINYTKNLNMGLNESSFIVIGVITFALTLISLFISWKINIKNTVSFFIIPVFILNSIDLYNAGSLQWAAKIKTNTERKILNIDEINMQSLNTPRNDKLSMISLTPVFNTGYSDEWSFESLKFFLDNFDNSITEENMEKSLMSLNELTGVNDGKRFFLTEKINTGSVIEFIDDSHKFDSLNLTDLKVEKYNGDELICNVTVKSDGYFSFIDNWDPNWKAFVNGQETEIEKLFGTFKSVKIGKGSNSIEFKYCPDFF